MNTYMKRITTRLPGVLLALTMMLLLPVAEADFLDDIENVETMYRYVNDTDYARLGEYVANYIEAEQPDQTDYAYKLMSVIDNGREAIDSIAEVIDDFDGSRSFTFDGVTGFDDGYCVLPGYSDARWLYVELGFIADDWVFYDKVEISVDGEIVVDFDIDSDERTDDVLDGPKVREKTYCPVDAFSECIDAIHDGDRVAIRFSNSKDDSKFQHVLKEEEENALYHCWQIFLMRGDLIEIYEDYLQSPQYQALLDATVPITLDNGYPMYPSGAKSRFISDEKTTLDDAIFGGTEREQEKLKGTVYIVTGALVSYNFGKPELRIGDYKFDIIDTQYTREAGADYTAPAEGETVNFILTYDHSISDDKASFLLGADESTVLGIRTR